MGLVVMSFVVFFPPMVVVVGNGLQVAGCLFVVEVLWCIFFPSGNGGGGWQWVAGSCLMFFFFNQCWWLVAMDE